MGDDDAFDLGARQMRSDARTQRPHALHGHMRTGKGAEVIDLELRDPIEAGRERQDVTPGERGYGPARRGIVAHGDRPAGEYENDHPQSTLPPFTFTISPVMCRASAEQRNTIGPAMSRASATRPSGIVAAIRSRPPSA